MNNKRRKEIGLAVARLENAKEDIVEAMHTIESCRSDEEAALDALPESLHDGENGDAMQDAIDKMDEAFWNICDWPDTIDSTILNLKEAIE